MGKTKKTATARQLVTKLLESGVRVERIAADLEVHTNTVLRWRDGQTEPHPGHYTKLRDFAAKYQ